MYIRLIALFLAGMMSLQAFAASAVGFFVANAPKNPATQALFAASPQGEAGAAYVAAVRSGRLGGGPEGSFLVHAYNAGPQQLVVNVFDADGRMSRIPLAPVNDVQAPTIKEMPGASVTTYRVVVPEGSPGFAIDLMRQFFSDNTVMTVCREHQQVGDYPGKGKGHQFDQVSIRWILSLSENRPVVSFFFSTAAVGPAAVEQRPTSTVVDI